MNIIFETCISLRFNKMRFFLDFSTTMEDVRIVCISGMIEDDKIQELKLAGADDFLGKPFDVDVLIEKMCVQLDMEVAVLV